MLYGVYILFFISFSEKSCPITAIDQSMIQPDFDIHRFAGLWYVHSSTTTMFGNSTRQSMFRELTVDENGGVKAVYTYTDYQYAIGFLMYCANLNSEQECLELRKQVEIWSKSTSPIPIDVMRNLKRKAVQTLCVQMNDFTDQELGTGDSSDSTSHKPSVRNVHAEAVSSTAVNVSWDPPREGASEITKYQIIFYVPTEKLISFVDTTNTSCLLTGLRKFTVYGIVVVPYNANGRGIVRHEELVRTDSDIPSGAPQNVVLQVINSTSFNIRWEPPVYGERNGLITGYVVTVRKPERCIHQVTVPRRQRSYTVTGLTANQTYAAFVIAKGMKEYEVNIKAINAIGQGEAATIRTMTKSDTVLFTWDPIPADEQNGVILNYRLVVAKGTCGDITDLDPSTRSYVATNLEPGTLYRSLIMANTAQGRGPSSVWTEVTTLEEGSTCPIDIVPVFEHFQESQFLGTWYTVYQTSYLWGNSDWSSSTFKFVLDDNRNVNMIFTGHSGTACTPVTSFKTTSSSTAVYNWLHGSNNANRQMELVNQITIKLKFGHMTRIQICLQKRGKSLNCGYKIVYVCHLMISDMSIMMSGLWYEITRTRFTFNDMESIIYYFNTERGSEISSQYAGTMNGVCHTALSSLTKRRGPEYTAGNKCTVPLVKSLHGQEEFDINQFMGEWKIMSFLDHSAAESSQRIYRIATFTHRQENSMIMSLKQAEGPVTTAILESQCHSSMSADFLTSYTSPALVQWGNIIKIITNTFVKILYTDYQDAVFYICKKVQDDGSCNSQDMLVFVLSKTGNQVNTDKVNEINGYWYEIAHTYSPIFTWHSMIVYYQADQFKLGYSGARPEDNVCVGPALGLTKPRCTPTTADFLAPWKILYTDYDTALIPYSCMKVLPDGSCAPYFRRLHILTRNKTISPDLRTKLNSIVAQTCIDPASLLDVTHSVDCKPLIDSVFNPEVK
ncbi:hypothetical protein KUTeg_021594 [Tegillarca granosa]|uniref:Fibronectin type-III domain-containing protein n=1 Tax=Tegillarca granosa TaxID=220873 RepID=A0ABQ9E9A1_TEGGR|nr:hypothetical protein KUTeg_021594 [Tegillarca granosa]